jgi:hypothetical protein
MKLRLHSLASMGTLVTLFFAAQISGCAPSIKFTYPVAQYDEKTEEQLTIPSVESPVEVCMDVKGYILNPAQFSLNKSSKKAPTQALFGDDDGYGEPLRDNIIDKSSGHYHLLVDVPVSEHEDLNLHMKKDENHIPMVNGEPCKVLFLAPGLHKIQAIFAYENHTPVQPTLTKSIHFTVIQN